MNYSGFMGGLYALAEWIMRFSIINIVWIITNLPILGIVFLMVFTPTTTGITVLAVPLVILLPVLFFPSTAAVFAMVREWIMKKEDPSLVKMYWQHFKENYKKGLLSGIILTLFWLVWVIDFNYFYKQHDVLGVVLLIIGLILFVYTINFFNLYVHYHMTIKKLLKNAFFITVGSPLLFFVILIGDGLLLYMSMTKLWFMFPFFIVSICAFLSFWAFYHFTLKVAKKAG